MSSSFDAPNQGDQSVVGLHDPQVRDADLGVDSSLELDKVEQNTDTTPMLAKPPPQSSYRRLVGIVLVALGIMTIGLFGIHNTGNTQASPDSGQTLQASQLYKVQSLPLNQLNSQLQPNNQQNTSTLSINGLLKVNNSITLEPITAPTDAVQGQIYYDKTKNQLAYFNGSSFIYIQTPKTSAGTTIGGSSGAIALATGLRLNGNSLSNAGVLSFNGQSGKISLTGGTGIGVNGTTISNTGVTSIGGHSGSISTGSGLGFNGGKLRNTGVLSLASGTPTLVVNNDGNGNLTITNLGGGSGNVSTSGGTAGTIALFNGAATIGDSILSQSGTTVTAAGTLSATTLQGSGTAITNLSATNISSGTLANGRLSATVTLQGNVFNGGNELLQLNGTAGIPALNGSLLTNLNATNISLGTLSDNRLSSNVSLLNGNNNFTGSTLQHNGSDVCDTSGNCVGVGGGVSSSGGSANVIPKYTGATTIGPSLLSDNGTTVSNSGKFSVTGTTNLTGALTLGSALTVGNGGTGSTSAAGARSNLGAAASGANSDITSLSGLTTALSVLQGGSGATSLTSNGVLIGNGTSPVSSLVAGSPNLCLESTAGVPVWAACTGGAGGGVTSLDSQIGVVSIANSSGAGGVVTIQDASTIQKGIAQFNATNFSAAAGVINTIQDISTASAPTFAQLALNSSQATNPMLVINNTNAGATGNLLDLQLNGSSKFSVAPSGATQINNNLTVSSNLIVGGGAGLGKVGIQGTSGQVGLVVKGAAGQTSNLLQLNDSSNNVNASFGPNGNSLTLGRIASSGTVTQGNVILSDGTTDNFGATLNTGVLTANVTYQLQAAAAGTYQICTTAGNCLGGGSGGANTALSNLTGVAINTSLLPGSAGGIDLGSGTLPFGNLYFAGSSGTPGTNNIEITGASTGGNEVISVPDTAGAADTFCLHDLGNCVGAGGGITGSGTAGQIAKFTSGGAIGDSILSESGSTVTATGNLNVSSGNQFEVNGSQISSADLSNDANLAKLDTTQTFTGNTNTFQNAVNSTVAFQVQNAGGFAELTTDTSNNKVILGNITATVGQGVAGTLELADGTNDNFGITLNTSTLTGNATISLPDTAGVNDTICLQALNNCSGSGSNVSSVDLLTGALNIANSTGSGSTITINDAKADGSTKGIATFNATNFKDDGAGTINTIQDISATSSPTFSAVNTNTITPSGALLLGATGQSFTLEGSASSTILASGGGFNTTLGFSGSPTGAVNYNFDRGATTGTYTVCTSAGNCVGGGGGGSGIGGSGSTNQIAKFTAAGTIGNSSISDTGSSVTVTPSSNSTNAFQLQNASGANLFNVDTSTTVNLLPENASNFETGQAWTTLGSGVTLTQDTAGVVAYSGTHTLKLVTTAAGPTGAQYPESFTAGTNYTFSVYARLASGTMTTFVLGYHDTADHDCTASGLSTQGWNRIICGFNASATASGYLYIKDTGNGNTFYVDAAQFEAGSQNASPYNGGGQIQLNGVISSPLSIKNASNSNAALEISNAAGSHYVLQVDTNNNRVGIDIGANGGPGTDLAFGSGSDRTISINTSQAANGRNLTLIPGASTGGSTFTGGSLFLEGAGTNGSGAGGNVTITPGTSTGGGAAGTVFVKPTAGGDSSSFFQVQNASSQALFGVDTSGSNVNVGVTGSLALASTVNVSTTSDTSSTQIVNIGSKANTNNTVTLEAGNTGGINIGTSNANHTINVGTGTGTQSVTVGSSSGASTTNIYGGTGNINLFGTTIVGHGNAGSEFQVQDGSNANVFNVDTLDNVNYWGYNTDIGGSSLLQTDGKLNVTSTTSDTASTALKIMNSSGQVSANIDGDGTVDLGGNGTISNLGTSTLGTTLSGSFAGIITAQKVTTTTGGTIKSISSYIKNPAGAGNNSFQYAIYTDSSGAPGSYIASSSVRTLGVTDGWYTLPVTATLSPTTNYWLVYWTNDIGGGNQQLYTPGSGSWIYHTLAGTAGDQWQCTSSCTNGLPNSFPVASGSSTLTMSMYATFADSTPALLLKGSNGAAIFENSTNSTSAFQIQNASGSNIVNVDTTNSKITLTNQNASANNPVLTIANSDNTAGIEFRSGGSGGNNTFIGNGVGASNSVAGGGASNTAVGNSAFANNTNGQQNSAFGYNSLNANTTGNQNTAIGSYTLQNNHTGAGNTALGHAALAFNDHGGSGAGGNTGVGDQALTNNDNGRENTAVGGNAGLTNVSGTDTTFLGYDAGNTDGTFTTPNNLQNAAAIGAYAQVQANNSLILGADYTNTNVGIGTTIPLNTFSVSPVFYNTGTAYITSSAVTGVGTTWTSAMIGMEFIFANGEEGLITAVGGNTSLTINTTPGDITSGNAMGYRIHNIGFQVTSAGNAYVQSTSTSAFQVQNASGSNLFSVDTSGNNVNIGAVGSSTSSSTIHIADTSNNTGTQAVTIGSNANANNSVTIDSGSSGNINIGNTATNHTINIGTGSAAEAVGLGSSGSGSTTTIRGGSNANGITLSTAVNGSINLNTGGSGGGNINVATGSGNINLTSNGSAVGTIVASNTNSSFAFQVQNANGNAGTALLNANTTSGNITLAGNTNDNTASTLTVQDTYGVSLLNVRNDGHITLGEPGGSTINFGHPFIGATVGSGFLNLVAADKFTTGNQAINITSISAYDTATTGSPNNKYVVGIYDATGTGGAPGTLLVTSAQGTLTAAAWNTIAVGSTTLSANTSYWLAFSSNTNNNSTNYVPNDPIGTNTHKWMSGWGSAGSSLPASFTVSGTASVTDSIYATGTETGAGTTLTVDPTGGATVKTSTNTSTAFQVQNASGNNIFNVDTSANSGQGQVTLGKASANNAQLLLYNSTNNNTITLLSGATAASGGSGYTLTLPTTGASGTQCLTSTGGSTVGATTLIFGTCGAGVTLQSAYNTSAGASPSIDETLANGPVTIQNDNSSGITGSNELFGVHDKTASGLGNSIFKVNADGTATLGTGSAIAGTLKFQNATNGNTVTLNTGATAASGGSGYTLSLPTTGSNGSLCLEATSGSTAASTALQFASCANSNASITHVADWQSQGSPSTGMTVSPSTAGDLMVVSTWYTGGTAAVSGGGVTTWTKVTTNTGSGGTGKKSDIWFGTVTSAGSTSLSVTGETGTSEVVASEFTVAGVTSSTTYGIDPFGTNNAASGTTVSFPTLTPQSSGELYYGYAQASSAMSGGVGTGFTFLPTSQTPADMIAYNTSVTGGTSYTPTATQASSTTVNTTAAIFVAYTSNIAINNSISVQNANFNVQSAFASSPAGVLQGNASQTSGDIFDVKTGAGNTTLAVDYTGKTIIGSDGNVAGTLTVQSNTSGKGITLQNTTGSGGTSYTLTLPTSGASAANLCLESSTTSGTSGTTALAFSACANANVSITHVNDWNNNGSGALTVAPTTIGDLMVFSATGTGGAITSVSGGGVTTWSKAIINTGASGTGKRNEIWFGTVTSTGSTTVNQSGLTGATEYTASEFTAVGVGASTTYGVNVSGTNNGTSATVTYPSLTAQTSGELYYGYGQTTNTSAGGGTSGFSYYQTTQGNLVAYNPSLTGASTYQPTGTQTSATYNTTAAIFSAFITNTAINNSTSLQSANFYVQAAVPNSVAGTLQANGTGDILDLLNTSGKLIANFTNNAQLILGNTAGAINGSLVFQDGADSNSVTINAPGTVGSAYSLTLPSVVPGPGLCLGTSASDQTKLVFSTCTQVAGAVVTYVSEWDSSASAVSNNNLPVTPVSVGDLLIMVSSSQTTAPDICGVQGGGVTTWTRVTSVYNGLTGANKKSIEMWRGVVTSTSSNLTIYPAWGSGTFTPGSGTNGTCSTPDNAAPGSAGEMSATEYTIGNAAASWNIDVTGTSSNSTSTNLTMPSLTPQESNEMYVGYGWSNTNSAAATNGTPSNFTYVKTTNGTGSPKSQNMWAYDGIVNGGTPTQGTVTQSSGTSQSIAAFIVGFGSNTSLLNTTQFQSGNFDIQSTASGNVTGKLQANNNDILDMYNTVGTQVDSFDRNGSLTVGSPSNIGTLGTGSEFSDGFETGDTSLWLGGTGGTSNSGGPGSSGVETTTVNSGKYAFEANTTNTHGYYAQQSIASNATVYARTYFDSTTIGNPTNLLDLGTAAIGSGTHMQVTIGTSGDICWTAFTGITAGCTSTAPTASAWHKLEVELVINNSGSGVLQIWLDNANIKNTTGLTTGTSNITNIAIGGSDATTTATSTTFFDNVAVDTVPTGDAGNIYVQNDVHVSGSSSYGNTVAVKYSGGAGAVEGEGIRVDFTPSGTSGSTWEGLRIVTTTKAASGVKAYGINLVGPGTGASGTSAAIHIDNGWDIGMAIDNGGIQMNGQADPSAPGTASTAAAASGSVKFYAQSISGRMFIKVLGPNDQGYALQTALFSHEVCEIGATASGTATAAGNCAGNDVNAGVSNAAMDASQAPTDTTGIFNEVHAAGTGCTTSGAFQSNSNLYLRGGASGENGFFYAARVYFVDTAGSGNYANTRFFAGMSDIGMAAANCPVDADNASDNRAGFAISQGASGLSESQFQFTIRSGAGGAEHRTATGMNFTAQHVYEFYVYCPQQGGTIYWRVDDLTPGSLSTQTGSDSTTADLPSATTAMRPEAGLTDTTGTTQAHLELGHLYGESGGN